MLLKNHLRRITKPFSTSNLLDFAKCQTLYPKIFWKDRERNNTILTLGSILTLDKIPDTDTPYRFFGAYDFFQKNRKTPLWNGFPETCFILPQFEITENSLTTNFLSSDKPPELNEATPQVESANPLLSRLDTPSKEAWIENVQHCLSEIDEGILHKIVLARKTTLQYEKKVDPFLILKSLDKKSKNCTLFAFLLSENKGFIGSSPECLYQRKGTLITTEAVAGTRRRGKTPEEDLRLKNELLKSEKDGREFSCVETYIEKILQPECEELHRVKGKKVVQTKTVQHLYQNFEGKLKPGFTDRKLIEKLHPTPAMGGLPPERAMEKIHALEQFDRGYYAAPIGYLSPDEAYLAVGIRSALIDKNEMHLFAGCGIVNGSDPEKEWTELDDKVKKFTQG